jgi:hypothetical protein
MMTNKQKAVILRTLIDGAKDKATQYVTLMNEGYRRDDLASEYHEIRRYLADNGVVLSMCYDKDCECNDCLAQYDAIFELEECTLA